MRRARAIIGLMGLLLAAACSADGPGVASAPETPTSSEPTTAPAEVTSTAAPTTPATTTTVLPTTTAPPETSAPAATLDDHVWTLVADGAPWGGRAGLRTATLDGRWLVLGGRTPRNSVIPGDSDLWGDVWASEDQGATWTLLAASGTAFPPRAYFQAVEHDGAVYVIGGQDFAFPSSTFFNDVWRSADGVTWEQVTAAAPWVGRAGLMAASFDGALFVFGGSRNDDAAIVGPAGPVREYFHDVWRSDDGGATWTEVTAAATWEQRAGGAVVVHDGAMYLLGGEVGFVCQPFPGCDPPYFNDVWRTVDGTVWEQVSEAAGWSPRPGHACESVSGAIVCFGGFGQGENPIDMWSSPDGATWTRLPQQPWNATEPAQGRYDFDSMVVDGPSGPVVVTVGGDRETFDFGDPENWLRVDDDVWTFAAPA
jgi:hypothetical protein